MRYLKSYRQNSDGNGAFAGKLPRSERYEKIVAIKQERELPSQGANKA